MSHSFRPTTYRQDEVHEIIQLAIAHQAKSGDLSREQLLEIADELGISSEDIQAAEHEWTQQRPLNQDMQAFIQWRQLQFRHHRTKFLIVNGFLIVLDFLTFGDTASGLIVWCSHALSFSLYIALIWGLFLTLDGWQSQQTEGRSFKRKFQQWQRRQWLKQSVQNFMGRFLGTSN